MGKNKGRDEGKVYLFRMTLSKRKKRHLMNHEGVNFPCLPSVKEVNAILTSNMVETLHHDPLASPKEYDVEAAEILDGGKLYIGMNELFFILVILCFLFSWYSLFILSPISLTF
jgi:hypothetical protein